MQVVGEGNQWQRREAIRYLIAADPNGTIQAMTGGMGRYLPLHQLLRLSPAMQLLFSEARRMGYVLLQTDGGYVLRRSVAPPAL